MSTLLSIVVCTYNRSEWLVGCLSSLELQCENMPVEVLVVDNNSNDETAEVVVWFRERSPKFKYMLESQQGLSYARNRGFREAAGEYVAYIDDDARVCPGWIQAILAFFEKYPDATGVGGQHSAFSSVPIPKWFPREYGSRSLGQETRLLQDKEWISGTNMVFRKNALVEAGGFDPAIGMNGNKLSYGEETQLILRMRDRGMKVYYCAEMRVEHAILPYKLTLRWLLKSNFANGYDGVNTFNYSGSVSSYLPTLAESIKQALLLFIKSEEKNFKARIYRSTRKLVRDLGFFVGLLGGRFK